MTSWTEPIIAGLAAACPILGAATIVGWKARDWLAAKFEHVGVQLSETRKTFHDKIDAHEQLDQERHEQNLERFASIRIELARHGSDNGEGRYHR